jgi:uncharacterized membrane protein
MSVTEFASGPIAAIAAMALATYLTRVSGYWLMGHVPMTLRVRRMLETLPGAIVVATIVPIVAKAGAPGLIGVTVAFATMLLLRRNEFAAVALGIAAVGLARAAGL